MKEPPFRRIPPGVLRIGNTALLTHIALSQESLTESR
jgi:hypothetical protein